MEKILSLVRENPGEVTLVTLAPLTNIALAIQKDPVTMRKVKDIVMMGGAIHVAGNKNRVAEFNIFVDLDAAEIVFNFPVEKTLVPLNACNDVLFSLEDFKKIRDKNLRAVLLKMMKPYIKNIKKDVGVEAALMYDPLTVFYLLNKKACQTYRDNVLVETKGEITRGMTVVDKRTISDGAVPNILIVSSISVPEFRKTFLRVLSR